MNMKARTVYIWVCSKRFTVYNLKNKTNQNKATKAFPEQFYSELDSGLGLVTCHLVILMM